MKELGDDRDEKNILRSIQRMVAGDARFSGEMRALLGLMERVQKDPAPDGKRGGAGQVRVICDETINPQTGETVESRPGNLPSQRPFGTLA